MEVLREDRRKARRDYVCGLCGRPIKKGETYDNQTNKFDGRLYTFRSHAHCSALCSKIWDFANPDPDAGMDVDTFIGAVRELVTEFYCPSCQRWDKDKEDCEQGFDRIACVKAFAKFMETHRLAKVRDQDGIPRWRMAEVPSRPDKEKSNA